MRRSIYPISGISATAAALTAPVKRLVDRAKQPSGGAFPLRNSLVPVRIMLVGAGLSASAVKETYRW
jgi:hypothetical protein